MSNKLCVLSLNRSRKATLFLVFLTIRLMTYILYEDYSVRNKLQYFLLSEVRQEQEERHGQLFCCLYEAYICNMHNNPPAL